MFNGTVLDVAVGLIFVFLMLSVACSLVNERIQSFFDRRAQMLKAAIEGLLGDEAKDLIGHPLIQALSQNSGGLPSYIPSATFAVALLESLVHKNADPAAGMKPLSFARVKSAVDNDLSPKSPTRKMLQSLLNSAQGDLNKTRVSVEHWFDNAMERLSGTYKRRINRWLLGLGFALALVTNADSIRLVQRLEHESTLRAAVTAQATVAPPPAVPAAPATADGTAPALAPSGQSPQLTAMKVQLDQLDLLFWDIDHLPNVDQVDSFPRALRAPEWTMSWMRWLLFKLAGCFMTALAVSLGAPFWFDLLGRLVNLRATGEKPARAIIDPPPPAPVAVVAPTVESTVTTTVIDTGAANVAVAPAAPSAPAPAAIPAAMPPAVAPTPAVAPPAGKDASRPDSQ